MSIGVSPPRFEDLFEQAHVLVARGAQADLRRAISAAYYGLFHFVLTEAADMVVGSADRSSARYSLVYRSVDHSRLRQLSAQLTNPQNLPLAPGGFGTAADFARVAGNLHELRNRADYDPSAEYTADEATTAISDARKAIAWFQQGTEKQQQAFLTLLLFKPR
jgi:uncharacterized protein (UPF0332 family)